MTPYTHINTNIWIWIDCCVGSGCEVNIATRVYVQKKQDATFLMLFMFHSYSL